jgi:hypothetical protein
LGRLCGFSLKSVGGGVSFLAAFLWQGREAFCLGGALLSLSHYWRWGPITAATVITNCVTTAAFLATIHLAYELLLYVYSLSTRLEETFLLQLLYWLSFSPFYQLQLL